MADAFIGSGIATWPARAKVSNLALSVDVRYSATIGPGTVQIRAATTLDPVVTLPRNGDQALAFSPDHKLLAIGVGASVQAVQIGQLSVKPVVRPIDLTPGVGAHCCDVDVPLALVWTRNGVELATGTEDQRALVWVGDRQAHVFLGGGGPRGARRLDRQQGTSSALSVSAVPDPDSGDGAGTRRARRGKNRVRLGFLAVGVLADHRGPAAMWATVCRW